MLQWNLRSRLEATEGVFFQQIRYENDMLKVYFPRMKKDQIGLNKHKARHVYRNPLMSAICPLRALTSYLFWFPKILMDYQRLFPGEDQKSRFNCLLHECFVKYKDKYQVNRDDATQLGSHCIRKGVDTYCCSAPHPGPHCECISTCWMDFRSSYGTLPEIWKYWQWVGWENPYRDPPNVRWVWSFTMLL